MQKKLNKPKKHAKHLIHAQSFKKNSKKVAWYSTVKIVNIFMPWISKIPLFWTKCYRFSSERHSLPFHVRPVQQYRRRRCRPRFQIVRSVISSSIYENKISIQISFFNCFSYQSVNTIFFHMHTFSYIFIPLHNSNLWVPLLYEDPHPDSPHSHANSPHSHPYSPHSHPDSPYSHPDSPHSHHSPHSVPGFPVPPFTDSRQDAMKKQ